MSAAITHWNSIVGGQSLGAGADRLTVNNPATGSALGSIALCDAAVVDAAVQAAAVAQVDWEASGARRRAEVLQRLAQCLRRDLDRFVAVEVSQTGRPVREMRAQLARLPEWFEYYAALLRSMEDRSYPFAGEYLNYSRRMALGVVGMITPWNHPLLILTKKLAPALAAGNAVVVKPSELAPLTPLMLAELLQEAGVPDGVYNVVTGLGAQAGKALAEHPGLAKIDVTGGTQTGRLIGAAAGANLAYFSAELGGKASMLVFEDMEVERAVSGALFASFIAAGQTCVQGARLLVHERLYEPVVQRLVERANALRIGDPTDVRTQVGPLIAEKQRQHVQACVARARQDGARIACGGQVPDALPGGYYYRPTVLVDVTPGTFIDQEEVFGPVVCVLPFRDEAHAIALANATRFGLACSVWTQSVARAHRVAHALKAGIVWINDHHRVDPSSPWGGFGESGLGKENGRTTYEAYTRSQSVVVNLSDEPFDWYADTDVEKRYS